MRELEAERDRLRREIEESERRSRRLAAALEESRTQFVEETLRRASECEPS